MTSRGAGSMTHALTRSLLVGLALLWLAGVLGSGIVLKRLIDQKSDDELQESAAILMSLVRHTDDLLVAAALLGETRAHSPLEKQHERFVYQIRDKSGRVMLRSPNAPASLMEVSLREGLTDAGEWRVLTLQDGATGRILQLADPLVERREALVTALLWLTVPLGVLLLFAALMVYRASRALVSQVERTAQAVSRQDPQALGLLPLDGVVTELRPAVDATNRLLARLASALEAERSFTYNSAHELRTPIAGALAQAQLLSASAEGTPMAGKARDLVRALSRLARLAERLLALARAEGSAPLRDDRVDLARVARLTADEFDRDPRLGGRRLLLQLSPIEVRGDLDAIGLAVRNLIENALVHGVGGTEIRVVCDDSLEGPSLAVIDDGPGVSSDDVRTLVKRFARGAAATGDGAGLGLSIVDTLARRMGARLALRSPLQDKDGGFEARLIWAPHRSPAKAGKSRQGFVHR